MMVWRMETTCMRVEWGIWRCRDESGMQGNYWWCGSRLTVEARRETGMHEETKQWQNKDE